MGAFELVYAWKTVIFCLCACTVLILYRKLNRNLFLSKGIPGLKLRFLNLVGHFSVLPRSSRHLQLYSRNTYFLQALMGYRQLQINHSLYVVWIFYTPFFILHKADVIEAAFNNAASSRKARSYDFLHPWLQTGLLTSSGEKWKKRRKLLTPSFHFDILKDFLKVINEHSQIFVQILSNYVDQECSDLLKLVSMCSLDIICETTLGVRINAQKNTDNKYLRAVTRAADSIVVRTFDLFQWIDLIYYRTKTGLQFRKDLNILHSFTKKVIRDKKKMLEGNVLEEDLVYSKKKALMDLLLDHHMKNKDFTENDVQEEIDTFAFEGHDTTSMGLTWTLYLIGLYPEVQKAIHEELDNILPNDNFHVVNDDLKEMKYLERVIKESMRIYPPVPIIGRITDDYIMLGKHAIPKGAELVINLYALHRNPDVFPNPEVFDTDRFLPNNTINRHPYAYVPFAAGPRNCIGQRFAMMELKVVLATVLKYYEIESLDPRDKILPTMGLILRPSHPVRIKITKRNKLVSFL